MNQTDLIKAILENAALPNISYLITPRLKTPGSAHVQDGIVSLFQARYRRNLTIAEITVFEDNRVLVLYQIYTKLCAIDETQRFSELSDLSDFMTEGRIRSINFNLDNPNSVDAITAVLNKSAESLAALIDETMVDEIIVTGSKTISSNRQPNNNSTTRIPCGFGIDIRDYTVIKDDEYTFYEEVARLTAPRIDNIKNHSINFYDAILQPGKSENIVYGPNDTKEEQSPMANSNLPNK